jgi:UDP-N-acetylmuramyl pentapeptide synthase
MKQKVTLFVLAYFRFFAQLQLIKINPIIIGVTASAGKTSALNAIHAVLKTKYKS